MAQMGRPKAEEPMSKTIKVRLTEEENKKLEEYCVRNSTTKSTVVRNLIKALLGK